MMSHLKTSPIERNISAAASRGSSSRETGWFSRTIFSISAEIFSRSSGVNPASYLKS